MARTKASNIYIPTENISAEIDNAVERYATQRRPFERRWYDNNFFDDGYHFRYLSGKTGKIVDESSSSHQTAPKRSIPKASRQIRGIASLLLQLEPYPAIYPKRVDKSQYPPIQALDPQTGQPKEQPNPEYLQALEAAKEEAKNIGFWLEDEWDEQDMDEKLIHMIILAAKHGISYLQVWPDAMTKQVESKVFDAFDVYLDGTVTRIYDSPSMTKAMPQSIDKIKSNENFDEAQRERISPDNKYASSEVKQAYMQARFGSGQETRSQNTLIQKETFIKEYITEENVSAIKESENADEILEGKNYGDVAVRHTFSTSNGWLSDEYVNLPEYPFVDFRFEPGLIYQVPLIERFIPANKSLDIAVSRVEGFANTMVTGIYQKRKGENFKIANIPGGQVIEYEGTPLTQMQPASVPAFMFNFISLLEATIEEQGASISTLNKLPQGVKSGVAIESVKASEYANLKIPSDMFKKTVKRIAERLIEQTADTLTQPKEIVRDEDGNSQYFDIIGQKGFEARQNADMDTSGLISISKELKVKIEIENGLGYTVEGKKSSMQQIADYMLKLAEAGYVSKGQVQLLLKKFLEIFQFGSTAEFMDALDEGEVDMSQNQIDQIKISVLEVLKDAGIVGEQADQKNIDTTKVGVLEAMKDTGLLDKLQQPQEPAKEPSKSISFKDLPSEGKSQLAAQAGIDISPETFEIKELNDAINQGQ